MACLIYTSSCIHCSLLTNWQTNGKKHILKFQDGYEPGCPLPFGGPPVYASEDPEPSGEAGQDLTMDVHIEMCGRVCVPAKMCLCAMHLVLIHIVWFVYTV